MKPAPFKYFIPETLDEAFSLLQQNGDEAKILAGGQSLIPMLNFRLVKPSCLIDINRIPKISYIEQQDGHLRIGALTRQRMLEKSELVKEKNGLLLEAVRLIGHPAIRTRGTIGGSISHADPTSELCALLATLDGEVVAQGATGTRKIAAQEFFLSYFTTALEPTEICAEIILPVLPPKAGFAFEEFTQRHGDFGIVGVAAVLEAAAEGKCTQARLTVAGAGPTPLRVSDVEEFLKGETLSDRVFEEAGRRVSAQLDPDSDLHASAEYRRHLAGVMAARALKRAMQRVNSSTGGKRG